MNLGDAIESLAIEATISGARCWVWIPSEIDSALSLPRGSALAALRYDPMMQAGDALIIEGADLSALRAQAAGRVAGPVRKLTLLTRTAVSRFMNAHAPALVASAPVQPAPLPAHLDNAEPEVIAEAEQAWSIERDGSAEARRCARYLEAWDAYKSARKVIERAEADLQRLASR